MILARKENSVSCSSSIFESNYLMQSMNVKANTRNYYNERINTVLQYINEHLNEELDIEKLALLGHYSPFHFHKRL